MARLMIIIEDDKDGDVTVEVDAESDPRDKADPTLAEQLAASAIEHIESIIEATDGLAQIPVEPKSQLN